MELSQKLRSVFHQRLIDVMECIHKICVENHIQYTLIGGSLIGALRHQGFIPWDDDIDIGMTWKNYCKFKSIVTHFEHEWIEFDIPGVSDHYYQCFIKAYDSRTTFWETQRGREYTKGIFIDIMPFSNAGNNKVSAYCNFKTHKLLQAFYRRKGYVFETGRLREVFFSWGGLLLSPQKWQRLIELHYKVLNKTKTRFLSDMDGSLRGIVPAKYFSKYVLCQFENLQLYRIEDADAYLSCVFGDYMQFPPEEERKPHHINYLNLDMPYKFFLQYQEDIQI